MKSLILVSEKSDGSMKGRQIYNGKTTREWDSKEKKLSPTVINEALVITSMIDEHKHCDIMGRDAPNAFIKVNLPEKEGSEQVFVEIVGGLVDYLVEMALET